jgi:hypothetical protein
MNGRPPVKRTGAHREHRRDGAGAFVPDPSEDHSRARDDLAEALAESYVCAATSGEQHADQTLDDFVAEELGGPFVQQDAEMDPAPERFPELAASLQPELTTEPDVLGFEPHLSKRSAKAPSGRGKRKGRA